MHVAVVTGRFPSVSETFVLDQITGLLTRGHEVTVIGSPPVKNRRFHPAVDRHDLRRRTLYWSGLPGLCGGRNTTVADLVRQCDVRRTVAALRALPQVSGAAEASTKIRLAGRAIRLSATPRFDAILCHFGHLAVECDRLRQMSVLRGPLAAVFHGWDMSAYLRDSQQQVYDSLFENADLLLPVSDCWRRRLLEMGAPSEKTIVQRIGVDSKRFSFRPRRWGDGVDVLTVARLVEKKGVRFGLEAFSKLVDDVPEARYTVVGDGPLRPALEAHSRRLGIEQFVEFTGWRQRDEVQKMMFEHDLLLAPSVTASDGDMEGIPVVVMEAMATGMPVVSTWHSGIPELVCHGQSGLLAAERDVDELARCLQRMAANPAQWSDFGRCGRRTIEQSFDQVVLTDRLVALLEERFG